MAVEEPPEGHRAETLTRYLQSLREQGLAIRPPLRIVPAPCRPGGGRSRTSSSLGPARVACGRVGWRTHLAADPESDASGRGMEAADATDHGEE